MNTNQTIDIPLSVGDRVSLGLPAVEGQLFQGTVEKYNPKTNKLSFEQEDVGYHEFMEMVEEAGRTGHSIEIRKQ